MSKASSGRPSSRRGGLVHHGEALALVRFSRHRGRGGRRIDGDDVESHPRQAARQQSASAAHDQCPAPGRDQAGCLHGARHVLKAHVLEGDGPDLPAVDRIWCL
jgi:hypothetical protein